MVSYIDLLLPVALATFVAWIASMLIHLLIKWHNSDYQPLKNESEVADAIRNGSPAKGLHSLPYCVDMKEMASEEMQKKFERGPIAFVTIFDNGMPPMPKLVGQQILFFLLGMAMIGYIARLALAPGAPYMEVLRTISALGFMTYGWAQIPMSIWYGHLWSTTGKYLLDALIYGFLAAGVFAWLWPAAT